jgi:hypothetical protein
LIDYNVCTHLSVLGVSYTHGNQYNLIYYITNGREIRHHWHVMRNLIRFFVHMVLTEMSQLAATYRLLAASPANSIHPLRSETSVITDNAEDHAEIAFVPRFANHPSHQSSMCRSFSDRHGETRR